MKNRLDIRKILIHFNKQGPTKFQGFWHGLPLGPLREACLQSFIKMGHTFELYTYGPLIVPDGVRLRNAEKIIPFNQVFYYDNPETGKKDIGPFSDLFRFKLLTEQGGWWMDVDTICLSPSIQNVEWAWAQQIPEVNSKAIGSGQIALPKGDPLAKELYSRCLALSKTNFQPREALGPHLISATINENKLPTNVYGSADTFYPIRWIEMFKLWLPQFCTEVKTRSGKALFLPIFQSFPQYIGLVMDKMPPKGSYLDEICVQYLPNLTKAEYYLEGEIMEGTRAFFKRHADWAINELCAVSGKEILERLGLPEI